MGVDHRAARLAIRTRLLALPSVVTTGVTTLAATSTGFTRTTGSFLADGFLRGMEVTPAGFVATDPGVVQEVSALSMTVSGVRAVEAAAAGLSLSVGIPAKQAWENIEFDPEDGRWFIEEEYIPGGAPFLFAGNHETGELDTEPTYITRLYGVQGMGSDALEVVSKGILDWFPPGLTLSTYAGQNIRVRADAAPYPGQIIPQGTGHAVIPITIPLYAWTTT